MAQKSEGISARNISSNLAGFLVSAVVALLLSPFIIRSLGDVRYGLWTLLIAVTGYYGILDLGVRSAVGHYVTRYWARKDIDGVNRTFSTAMVLLLGAAVMALAVTLGLLFFLPDWIRAKSAAGPLEIGSLITRAQVALVIVGCGIALQLPMALWGTVLYARERFDLSNAIGITTRLAVAGLTVLVLTEGYGIVGLAAVTVVTQFLGSLAQIIVAHRLMPQLRLSLRLFDRASVGEIGRYGVLQVMVNAADKIVLFSDVVVVGAFLTLGAVTYYEVGAKLNPYFMSLVLAVTWTMTPYATSCDARGDRDALRRLLYDGTRGSLFLASVIAAGLLLLGDEFLPLWIDPKYTTGEVYSSSYLILAILTWATLTRSSTSCGRQILFGMRRMKLLAGMAFAEALLNIGISITLVQFYGLAGVALGTLIPLVLIYAVVQNLFLVRLLAASGRRYFVQVLRATVPVMLAMALMSLWVDGWLVGDSWPRFLAKVLVLLVPVLPVGYLVVMNPDERKKLGGMLWKGRRKSDA